MKKAALNQIPPTWCKLSLYNLNHLSFLSVRYLEEREQLLVSNKVEVTMTSLLTYMCEYVGNRRFHAYFWVLYIRGHTNAEESEWGQKKNR